MLRVRLFGALSVEVDGRVIPEIAGLKPRSMLAWLLLHPGPHARARVAARFWPDVLDTSARGSLRSALWTVRAALEEADGSEYLVADRDSVGISQTRAREIDTETFESLCSSGAARDLERALALAQAPLLSDLADDWVLEARDDHAERAAAAALRLADGAEEAGDLRLAASWTRRALVHARLSEATHRLLVRRLAAGGELAEALAAYQRLEAILAAEFGTAPSPKTRALVAELRAGRADRSPGRARRRPEPSLVGRDREVARLVSAWQEAERGRGAVAILRGAAGMGKSRLAAELAGLVAASGGARATGAAFELEGAPPFSLWLEVLDQIVAGAPAPPQDAAWAAELARLCPAVESRWGQPPAAAAGDPGLGRVRLFGSVVQAIEWAAAQEPLLIVLEDLQLADSASLALLGHVAPRLAGTRTLLVATHRPVRRDELDAVVGALASRGAVADEVRLAPLASAEIETIVDATAPDLEDEMRVRVVGAADGSPLLAREGARAAAAGDDPAEGLRAWLRGPRAALPSAARVLVALAAAAARPLSLAEAAELLGHERLADAVAAATAAQLLADGSGVRFGHELLRAACYAEIEPARRVRLHSRLADVLSRRPRPRVAEVARHLLLAQDEQRAASYLAAAAEKARALGALDDAAGFLREAATAAPDAVAAELWLSLAEVEARRGNRQGHDAAFTRALPLVEASGDATALAEAYAARGRCLRTTLCYPREALAAYRRAAEIVEVEGLHAPELRALALAGAAWAEAAAGDVSEAESLIRRVERLPEAERDQALGAELALDRATALMRSGSFGAGEQQSLRAADLAHRAGRADLARLALNLAASAAAARGDFHGSLDHAQRAGDADRAGTVLEAESLTARAYALSRLGRHEEAIDAAARAQALAARSGDDREQAIAAFDAGSIALAAGQAANASRLLRDALDRDDLRLPRALARLRLAEARLGLGELEEAGAEVERFPFEPVGPADLPETLVPRLARVQGLLAAARGERELARRRLEEAERGWRRMLASGGAGDPVAASLVDLGRAPVAGLIEPAAELGRVLAERALLLAEEGRSADARAIAEEASGLADDLAFDGYRATLARAHSVIEAGTRARV